MRLRFCAALVLAAVPLFGDRAPARTLAVPSKILGKSRSVIVSLPERYDAGKERYPVLYMTDGALHLGHTIAAADALADIDRMPPVIIVAIPHEDRVRDLTPTHVDEALFEGVMRPYPTSGGGKDFGLFLAEELIPAVDARFRTAPYRMFAGHSFGALFGLDLFFDRPALFNAWILVSPAAGWDGGHVLRRAREFRAPARTAVMLMAGNEGAEMAEGVRQLELLLAPAAARGLDFSSTAFSDDDHLTVPIPAFYAGLRRAFKPWFFRILDSDDPDVVSARIVEHYKELSARYGYTIPIPQYRLERLRGLRRRR